MECINKWYSMYLKYLTFFTVMQLEDPLSVNLGYDYQKNNFWFTELMHLLSTEHAY